MWGCYVFCSFLLFLVFLFMCCCRVSEHVRSAHHAELDRVSVICSSTMGLNRDDGLVCVWLCWAW
ncbi:hypothetical protein KC19_12G116800 [Ceratodon purpureus]|uniref:Secreted protein n=1 Tax=Ceratodon purpureus TaxID=3225 RepID=A0A8T0G7E3_CERPU|nr:hypothetical protein KC19_12G116800 [Ceratodon purpureus]